MYKSNNTGTNQFTQLEFPGIIIICLHSRNSPVNHPPCLTSICQYTSSVPENQMPALVVVMAVTDADYPIHHPGGAGSELYRETPMASSTTPLDPLETRESSPPPRITMLYNNVLWPVIYSLFIHSERYALCGHLDNSFSLFMSLRIWTMRVLLCSVCWWWWRMRWWSLVDSDLHVDSDLVLYTATDPDTTMTQTVRYIIYVNNWVWTWVVWATQDYKSTELKPISILVCACACAYAYACMCVSGTGWPVNVVGGWASTRPLVSSRSGILWTESLLLLQMAHTQLSS